MALLDDIRQDVLDITSDQDEFGVEIVFTAPNGQTATVGGLHSKHHLGFDVNSGTDIKVKNAHISVSESLLVSANYPVRDSRGEVLLQNHQVRVKDSTGIVKKYVVQQWIPDETLGLILCILGDKQ
jgi:hypothetical protein